MMGQLKKKYSRVKRLAGPEIYVQITYVVPRPGLTQLMQPFLQPLCIEAIFRPMVVEEEE
jgi:hypothetical protein